MDFFVDKSYKNYIDPPPPMLDAMEEVRSVRFNVPQLKAIIEELAQVADEKNQIANRAAVELLVKKVRNSRSLGDLGGMPKDWSNFTQNNFELMLRNLDIYNEGQVDYRVLALCFVLLQSELPDGNQLESLKKELRDPEVSSESLTKAHVWFEKTEKSVDRDYSHKFDRVEEIKQVVFDLFKQQSGLVSVNDLVRTLKQINENYGVMQQMLSKAHLRRIGPK